MDKEAQSPRNKNKKKEELRKLQSSYQDLVNKLKTDVRKPLSDLRELVLEQLEKATYPSP